MARKKPDPVSPAAQRAFDKKARSFAKKQGRKLLNSPSKTKKATKPTKADNDATAILIMIVMLTLVANAISSAVNSAKEKFSKNDPQSG